MRDLPVETNRLGHQLGQFEDGHVLSAAHIDVLILRVVFHDVHQRVRAIVHMQEFPARRSRAPNHGLGPARHFRFVQFADEGRQHVARFKIEIVAGTIKIGGHGRDEIATILAAVGLAQLDPCDLGHCIPFIGCLERTGE